MDLTRRATVAGLAASLTTGLGAGAPAHAAPVPRAVGRHLGFKPWKVVYDPDPLPLELKVQTPEGGEAPLWAWLGRGPTVLILWATWCSPCLAEKSAQAYLSRRLTYLHAQTKMKFIQSFDSRSASDGKRMLDRLNARDIDTVHASPEMEKALLELFGPSVNDGRRTAMPSLLLLDEDAREIGRAKGTLQSASGQSYWGDATTMQFFAGLDHLLAQA